MKINRQELIKLLGYTGLVLLISGYFRSSVRELWTIWEKGMLIAGAVLVVISVVFNFALIRAFFGRRSTRLGTNLLVVTAVVAAILAMINFLGYRHSKRFDLTTEQLYSLSDQTRQILNGLKQEVKILKFDKQDDPVLRERVQEYEGLTRRVKYERIDPQEKPELARQYNITRMGEVIAASGSRTERLEGTDEQDVTNAILKVTREQTKTICFVEGHGEKPLTGSDASGYSVAEEALKNENYQTKSVNLVSANQIPSECTVLVLAGPQQGLFPQEVAMLTKFLDEGGKAMLMLDPDTKPQVDDLLKAWGIETGNDMVIAVSAIAQLLGTGPAVPLVTDYGSHPITNKMERSMTFFPLARSVKQAQDSSSDIDRTELLKTASYPNSWAETQLGVKQVKFDDGQDTKGPISLGVAASKKVGEKQARLVVFGDSDFASNSYISQAGNGNLFLNAVNWLAEDEDLISVRPKSPTNRQVTLTESQQNMISLFTRLLLPGIVLIPGFYVWWKRR